MSKNGGLLLREVDKRRMNDHHNGTLEWTRAYGAESLL